MSRTSISSLSFSMVWLGSPAIVGVTDVWPHESVCFGSWEVCDDNESSAFVGAGFCSVIEGMVESNVEKTAKPQGSCTWLIGRAVEAPMLLPLTLLISDENKGSTKPLF